MSSYAWTESTIRIFSECVTSLLLVCSLNLTLLLLLSKSDSPSTHVAAHTLHRYIVTLHDTWQFCLIDC